MTLRTKFFLATCIATVALVGVSEWVTYRQTTAFLDAHEAMMRHGPEGAALLALPAERHLLLLKLTGVRLLNAAIAMSALVAVLNVLWGRFIASPIQLLLRHINWMSRGTWDTPIIIRQEDEIGDLTRAFNDMGRQLTSTVQQFATASKLSALALTGQRIVSRTEAAKARIIEVKGALSPPDAVMHSEIVVTLDQAIDILNNIPMQVETEFDDQFRELRPTVQPEPGRTPCAPQATSKAHGVECAGLRPALLHLRAGRRRS